MSVVAINAVGGAGASVNRLFGTVSDRLQRVAVPAPSLIGTLIGAGCFDGLTRTPALAGQDGVYQIQPSGSPAPFPVYCDMTQDLGGWTLVARGWGGNVSNISGWVVAGDVNLPAVQQAPGNATGKFSNATVNAIRNGGIYRTLGNAPADFNVRRFWTGGCVFSIHTQATPSSACSTSYPSLTAAGVPNGTPNIATVMCGAHRGLDDYNCTGPANPGGFITTSHSTGSAWYIYKNGTTPAVNSVTDISIWVR